MIIMFYLHKSKFYPVTFIYFMLTPCKCFHCSYCYFGGENVIFKFNKWPKLKIPLLPSKHLFWHVGLVVDILVGKMGRYTKICHNVLHMLWCKTDSKSTKGKLPAYKYLVAFRNLAKEKGERSNRVWFICDDYINMACLKRDLTRHLKKDINFQ